jgi:hypothetical protein
MEPDQEFREFVELLEFHGVKFVIIGGYAVISHGYPRYTGDIDFFVKKSPDNARKLVAAINEFYGHRPQITEECFLDDDRNWGSSGILLTVSIFWSMFPALFSMKSILATSLEKLTEKMCQFSPSKI